MHESGYQEMASAIKALQHKLFIYETKLSEQEVENNSVQYNSKYSTKYEAARKISIEEQIRNVQFYTD